MSKLDALDLDVERPCRMVIRHPQTNQPIRDAEGKEAYIDLFSNDSAVAQKAQRLITNSRLQMRNRNKMTAERLETEATELFADLSAGWYLLGLDGSPVDLPFTRANAVELYSSPKKRWLREQVDEFTSDRANFSEASSKS